MPDDRATTPSLELLEFLGEFGDDEDGLFEVAERAPRPDPAPARRAPVAPKPATPPPPARDTKVSP